MTDLFDQLGVEPAHEAELAPLAPPAQPPMVVTLAQLFPGMPLEALLTFLPDIRVKQALEDEVAEMLAIDVTAPDGPVLLDRALGRVRERIGAVMEMFSLPASLAHQLHLRVTGLRADFIKSGQDAVAVGNNRLHDELQYRAKQDAERRRKEQEAADQKVRENAAELARQAEQRGAPPTVVGALQQQAATAVAPRIPAAAPAKLANSTTVDKWKARLAGTGEDDEPNPDVSDMTPAQQEKVRLLLKAVGEGTAPLACVKSLDWTYLNTRANKERTTLQLPGLEAFDASGIRGKGKRR